MDQSEDVERLFSWLKTPMVHYREFAPQRAVAEAVATWPVAHRAAVQAGVAAADEPAPQGDAAAKERLARNRMTLPPHPVQHVPSAEAAPYTPPLDNPSEPVPVDRPMGEAAAARPDAAAATAPEWEASRYDAAWSSGGAIAAQSDDDEPGITGFDQPAPAARRPEPMRPSYESGGRDRREDTRPSEPARHYPARQRSGLFSGEYRERGAAQEGRVPDRQDRSLEAVFSRISGGGRDRLPDPRARARTSPGLGPVFNRLR